MKRVVLVQQWRFLEPCDLETLNLGAGTIEVHSPKTGKMVPYKLTQLQIDLCKHAYERGLKHLPLY